MVSVAAGDPPLELHPAPGARHHERVRPVLPNVAFARARIGPRKCAQREQAHHESGVGRGGVAGEGEGLGLVGAVPVVRRRVAELLGGVLDGGCV